MLGKLMCLPFCGLLGWCAAADVQADVVLINESGDPPVVRLIAFSKYKYELEKSAKQKQKASKGWVQRGSGVLLAGWRPALLPQLSTKHSACKSAKCRLHATIQCSRSCTGLWTQPRK